MAQREFTFLLSHEKAEALMAAIEPSAMMGSDIEQIDDMYYGTSELTSDPETSWQQQYRIRRNGHRWDVFLDRHRRKRGGVSLRRTVVPSCDLKHLESDEIDASWRGKWFHKQIRKHQLVPTCRIGFERNGFDCDTPEGPIRLTIDRNARCQDITDHVATRSTRRATRVMPWNMVRMRYDTAMPAIFKSWVYDFALLPKRTSIYGECVKALELVADNEVKACRIG